MNAHNFTNIHGEQGGARLKLVVFLVIFGAILYAGYLYVPVAIDAYYFKDVMQNMANQATAEGSNTNWLRDQLVKSEPDYHVPREAVITPSVEDKRIKVRVQFTRPISFPLYTYNYEFDYTAESGTFLTK
jgi:hypothetical protein